VLTTAVGREVFASLPYVDEVMVVDKGWRVPRARRREWVRALRERSFDVAIAAQRSFRTGKLLWRSRAPRRIGYSGAPGRWFYHDKVVRVEGRPVAERYLGLAAPLGSRVGEADPRPELRILPEAQARADDLLTSVGLDEGGFLAVAPGSVWATKRWLPEGFAAVVTWAKQRGTPVALIGSEAEVALCREVADSSGARPAILAGRTGIQDLAGILRRATALVANDSGPGHVASAVGTRVLSIFGPTVPAFGYAPVGEGNRVVENHGLSCRPCDRHGPRACPLNHFCCMRDIEDGTVIGELEALLAQENMIETPR
jgi:heptosyltransferase-2